MPKKYVIAGIVLLGLDRITKVLAVKLPFSTLMVNENLAFSLPLPSSLIATITIVLSVMVVLFFLWQLYFYKDYSTSQNITLGLIVIGASSNIYDRIVYGGVIDFIDIGLYSVFNMADLFVIAGVLLGLWAFNQPQPKKPTILT